MSDSASAPESALHQLADAISRYAGRTTTETREIERTEEVEKEVVQEQTVTVTEEREKGPHPIGYGILAIGVVSGTAVALFFKALVGIVALLVGGGAGIAALTMWKKTEEVDVEKTEEVPTTITEEVTRTETVEKEVTDDRRVVRAGRGTLTFTARETPEGALVEGPETVTRQKTLDVPTIDEPGLVYEATDSIEEELGEIPWVLDGTVANYEAPEKEDVVSYTEDVPLRGEEQSLRTYFREIEDAFSDRHTVPVEVEVLENPGLFGRLDPVLEDADDTHDTEPTLSRVLEGEGGRKLEDFAEEWTDRWMRVNLALLEARSEALFEQVGPDCYQLGRQVGYAAFNFYCPHCNQDQQEELLEREYDVHDDQTHEPIRYSDTTRCLFRPEEGDWICKTCERTTDDPIPIHRMLDGVLFPAYDHLMQENKNERLRIHSKARDQERDLKEKAESEIDSIRREHMSEIFSLSEEMERFQADIAGEQEAIESMQALLDQYEMEQDQTVADIERFSREVREEVQQRTDQVLNEVDTVKEREMEALEAELDELSKAQRIEDERRDALLSDIAENTERSAEANERTAEASEQQVREQRKTREAVEENTAAVKENTEAVRENTEVTREVGNKMTEELKKQTAMRRAEQEKMGIRTDDYSTASHPARAVGDAVDEFKGQLLGSSREEIEAEKM